MINPKTYTIVIDSKPEFLKYNDENYSLKLFVQLENANDLVIPTNNFKTELLKQNAAFETLEIIKERINHYLVFKGYNPIWCDFGSKDHKKR